MITRIATSLYTPPGAAGYERLLEQLGDDPVLVTAFASPAHPLGAVLTEVCAAFPKAIVIGATTAGELTEKGAAKQSIALAAISGPYRAFAGLGRGLRASPNAAVEQAVSGLPSTVVGFPYRTAIVLLDPMAGNGEEATLLAASLLGDDIRLVGGAAGDDLQMAAPQVGLGTEALSDAIVITVLFSKIPLGIGVCHGHEPISKQLKVTKADDNLVIEIEGRPAWEVWAEHTREHARLRGINVDTLEGDQVGAFLLLYEGGLSVGDAYKIRAPLAREGTSIRFATAVPEGCVLRITESTEEKQIASAREAARRARAQLGVKSAGGLVFDCICRNLILKDSFVRAVTSMSEELDHSPIAGFETYGEIALDTDSLSGFHNTTSVVLAFPEG